MHNHLDFSYDNETFGNLPDMVDDIHAHGQKYVIITVSHGVVSINFVPLKLATKIIVATFRTLALVIMNPMDPTNPTVWV